MSFRSTSRHASLSRRSVAFATPDAAQCWNTGTTGAKQQEHTRRKSTLYDDTSAALGSSVDSGASTPVPGFSTQECRTVFCPPWINLAVGMAMAFTAMSLIGVVIFLDHPRSARVSFAPFLTAAGTRGKPLTQRQGWSAFHSEQTDHRWSTAAHTTTHTASCALHVSVRRA